MKRKYTAIMSMMLMASMAQAQRIDFDFLGRNNVTADDYEAWAVDANKKETWTKTLDGVTFTLAPGDGLDVVKSQWNKNDVNKVKLTGDGITAYSLDSDNNTPLITDRATSIVLTITGLKPGVHTLQAHHNGVNNQKVLAPISITVDGQLKVNGLQQSANAQTLEDATLSLVSFVAEEGKAVEVVYSTVLDPSTTYENTQVYLNSLMLDQADVASQAQAPQPESGDMHAVADDGSVTLSWTPALGAVTSTVYLGTSADNMQQVQASSLTSYTATDLSSMQTYYWRVDQTTQDGTVTQGDVWTFRPRHLAFPGAEGWGKWAIGGRGGVVYHVTTLEDNGDDANPVPGSLRYGIKKVSGPRTIVFDVAGVISLKSRLTCSDKYVTIAGQTAPGNGITLRTSPFGMADEGITRFMRMRLGHKKLLSTGVAGKSSSDYGSEAGTSEETTVNGMDGMGMSGGNNSIMDHCSISWTIDEAFSSRGGKSLTLQRTLISETLNQAGHPNYGSGTQHGYAATIGGGEMSPVLTVGSYHHNLLAHNEGRNWSLSGGLDGAGYYDGHHDVFNNVVYNWGGRATDGGTHELNFVGNYYKMGPATTQTYLLKHQFEGTGKGTQSAYVSGNVRQAAGNGSITEDKLGTTYRYELSGGQTLDWKPWATAPFFESQAEVESARAAYKNVLSDVGANQPFLDPHDERMVSETLAGTYSVKGSRSKKKGLIDSEEDAGCEGFDGLEMVETTRPADWDTDQDGMPDWWEKATDSNPAAADNNEDPDGDGYTLLEDYLNYMAEPHFEGGQSLDLRKYFAGYDRNPQFAITATTGSVDAKVEAGMLTVEAGEGVSALTSVTVSVTDDDQWATMQRTFHFYFAEGTPTGVERVAAEPAKTSTKAYDLQGRGVSAGYSGVVVKEGKKLLKP